MKEEALSYGRASTWCSLHTLEVLSNQLPEKRCHKDLMRTVALAMKGNYGDSKGVKEDVGGGGGRYPISAVTSLGKKKGTPLKGM